MKIAVGCDHRALEMKQAVMKIVTDAGHTYEDFGSYTTDSVDYPDIAAKVAAAVLDKQCDLGVLICGTGIGMSIAANKVKGIRAALCHNVLAAERARQHNDASILCMGAEPGQVVAPLADVVNAFLTAGFEGGRHQRRVEKMTALEC